MRLPIFVVLALVAHVASQSQPSRSNPTHRATGTFDVKVAPLEPYIKDDNTIARFSLDKQFHGALEATSKGEMLSSGNPASNAGAVALEKVTGKLDGRSGTFVLQHDGLLVNAKPQKWTITVVPASGTGGLQGLAGAMQIKVENGKHSYVFEYTLPEKQ